MNVEVSKPNTGISKKQLIIIGAILFGLALLITVGPAFAGEVALDPQLGKLLETVISYIGLIFRVVGILLLAYSVGQMIMAFKDDNPDAKTKASTMIVVAFILISIPTIIKQLNLVSYLT